MAPIVSMASISRGAMARGSVQSAIRFPRKEAAFKKADDDLALCFEVAVEFAIVLENAAGESSHESAASARFQPESDRCFTLCRVGGRGFSAKGRFAEAYRLVDLERRSRKAEINV
ncbi:MAG: hypothetical protein ACXWNK_06195 [Vulcanimicrobiaceae bacterium]